MAILFNRAIIATIGTTRITGLRMVFKAHLTPRSEPNTLELGVYNLSPDTRSRLSESPEAGEERMPVLLEAGYSDAIQQISIGRVREIRTSRQEADWVTTIQAADGEAEMRAARVNLSFGKGAKVGTVLQELAKSLKVNAKKALNQLQSGELRGNLTEFANGFVASGGSMIVLERMLRSSGLEGSIQDGELQIVQAGKPLGIPSIKLDAQSGLIGVPEIGEKGRLKARSLLQGGLVPRRIVRVVSEVAGIDGDFRVQDVVHNGDTHGQPWYSDIEGIPI